MHIQALEVGFFSHRDGAVVRALASHQRDPGSIDGSGVTAFCVPPCNLFLQTLITGAVCYPFAITINMIAEYEYRKYPKYA